MTLSSPFVWGENPHSRLLPASFPLNTQTRCQYHNTKGDQIIIAHCPLLTNNWVIFLLLLFRLIQYWIKLCGGMKYSCCFLRRSRCIWKKHCTEARGSSKDVNEQVEYKEHKGKIFFFHKKQEKKGRQKGLWSWPRSFISLVALCYFRKVNELPDPYITNWKQEKTRPNRLRDC